MPDKSYCNLETAESFSYQLLLASCKGPSEEGKTGRQNIHFSKKWDLRDKKERQKVQWNTPFWRHCGDISSGIICCHLSSFHSSGHSGTAQSNVPGKKNTQMLFACSFHAHTMHILSHVRGKPSNSPKVTLPSIVFNYFKNVKLFGCCQIHQRSLIPAFLVFLKCHLTKLYLTVIKQSFDL